jgi:hypothetical protein
MRVWDGFLRLFDLGILKFQKRRRIPWPARRLTVCELILCSVGTAATNLTYTENIL